MKALLAVLLLSVASVANSALEPPTPSRTDAVSQQKGDAAQQNANSKSNERATKSPTAVIEISPATVLKVEATNKTENHHDYASSEWWLVYLTGALVLVTLGLAIYTARLYRATVKLGEEADKTSTRQAAEMSKSIAISEQAANAAIRSAHVAEVALVITQRAYVSLIAVDRDMTRTYPTFDVRFKNTGHTPAVNLVPVMKVHLAEWPLVSNLPEITPGKSKSTLGPNIESGMKASWNEEIPLPENDVRFSSGKNAIYVYGRIDYEDTFGTKRFTTYRFAYRLAGTGKIFPIPESEGNESS